MHVNFGGIQDRYYGQRGYSYSTGITSPWWNGRVTIMIPRSRATFNMVVDEVICHWVILVSGEEAGPEGF